MYAIVRTGGKQVKVSPGETVKVEKIDASPGDVVELTEVLLVKTDDDVKVGNPTIEGAKVTCRVVEQGKGDKIIVYKYKRRKGYHKKKGHRQLYTALQVEEIVC
ncbi:MAG: 50S ribosomal protein L21 [Deltaproteobacteria bacterium]|nr:MAG: 50S ribosomal protein L21 [Deltaproteobacteria bacterium]